MKAKDQSKLPVELGFRFLILDFLKSITILLLILLANVLIVTLFLIFSSNSVVSLWILVGLVTTAVYLILSGNLIVKTNQFQKFLNSRDALLAKILGVHEEATDTFTGKSPKKTELPRTSHQEDLGKVENRREFTVPPDQSDLVKDTNEEIRTNAGERNTNFEDVTLDIPRSNLEKQKRILARIYSLTTGRGIMQSSDNTLVEKAKRGDQKSQFQLYKTYNRVLFNSARRIVNDESIAEDIIQDSFVEAFRQFQSYTGQVSFGEWMRGKVLLRAVRYIKERESDTHVVESRKATDEITETLEKKIDSLQEEYRIVLSLKYLEGYSIDEISNMLKISKSSSLIRLRAAMRALISESGELFNETHPTRSEYNRIQGISSQKSNRHK